MTTAALTAAAALVVAPAALAGPVKATQNGATLTVTAKHLQPATAYGASCQYPAWLVGSSPHTSNGRGKVTIELLIPAGGGPYVCWVRSDLGDALAAPVGKRYVVTGVAS